MIVLKREVHDKVTNKHKVTTVTCSGFFPIRNCTKISSETRKYLIRRKIFWVENLLALSEVDLKRFSSKFISEIETIWRKLQKKTFLNQRSHEVLRYLNYNGVRLTQYDRDMIVAISNFNFLYEKQDIQSILLELLPHLFSEQFKPTKRDLSKGRKIRQAFTYDEHFNKQHVA